jgi:paraquat-inducible protein B
MSEPTLPPDFELPPPHIRAPRRWRLSLIWLVPAVAIIAGLALAIRSYVAAGPSITIQFETAEGLDTGKTAVRFKDLDIGKVERIELSEDHSHVIVTIDLRVRSQYLAVRRVYRYRRRQIKRGAAPFRRPGKTARDHQ